MPGAKQPEILDLPTPLTRRRKRMRILAMLATSGLVVALALILLRVERAADGLRPQATSTVCARRSDNRG